MTAATCVVFTSFFTSGVQRTTRPVQCNTTSVGVPIASAGILMVKLTILPTTKEVASSNRTPLAEIFSVTAGRSPVSVQIVIGTQRGKRTAARSSSGRSVATAVEISICLIIARSSRDGNPLKRPPSSPHSTKVTSFSSFGFTPSQGIFTNRCAGARKETWKRCDPALLVPSLIY
jgi:hypothetical protein